MLEKTIQIIADNREKRSGLPDLLSKMDIEFSQADLIAGDYLINDEILIERKTKHDFIQSLLA